MATIEVPLGRFGIDWTPEILRGLPSDYRYEVWEGRLVVAAAAMRPWHADGVWRICRLLVHQGRLAYIEQGVFLGPHDLVTSDVAAFRDPPANKVAYHPARGFELNVEVVSPDSRTADRIIKPAKYWRVEEADDGEAVVHQHKLVRETGAERYVETRVVMLSTLEKESL